MPNKTNLEKIEQIESEILNCRTWESYISKYIEVEFEDFFVEVEWCEIEVMK